MNPALSNRTLLKVVFIFFVFGSLFPSFRVGMIGTQSATGFFQILISVLPDIFTLLLLTLLFFHIKKSGNSFYLSVFDTIFIGFLLLNISLGFLIGGNITIGLYALRLSYFPTAFYFMGRYFYPFEKKLVNEFLHWILYWIAGLAIIGIVLYFGFPETTAELIQWSGGQLMSYYIPRMTSILWTTTVFASIIMFGTLFSYYNIQLNNKLKYYIFFALFCICLFFSVSRAPLFTFLIGFITLTIVFKQWKRFLICIGIVVSLYIFFMLTIDSFDKVLSWIFSSTLDTLMMKKGVTRVELLIKTFHDLQTNPFGYGFGKAGMITRRFFTEDTPHISYYSTDCWYLKMACETGIAGFISYLTIIILHGWGMAKYLFKNRKETLLVYIFIMFCLFNIGNVAHNLPDYALFSNLYWLLMGIGQNYILQKT